MDVRFLTQLFRMIPLAILATVAIVVINNQAAFSRFFPIRDVSIYGARHVDREAVKEVMVPYVNHGFFNVDVESIHDRLLQLPWVAATSVRRHWPDQVEVIFFEKEVVGRWNDIGLLSTNGDVFSPPAPTYPANLPGFIGPDGSQMEMLEYYQAINRILAPLHATISYLELTPYATWQLKMSNGMLLKVGHKEVLTRLNHFVKVYPKIIGLRDKDVEYVDLRYSNGVAIRWKVASL